MEVLEALNPGRTAECPSELTLTLFDTGALAGPELAAVQAHLRTCPRCQAWLDEAKADFQAIPRAERDAMVTRLVARSQRPRRRWPVVVAGTLAAAAAVLLFVHVPTPGPDTTLKGGGLDLRVYRERGGEVSTTLSGEAFQAGDRLRFEVDVPDAGHMLVVGVEADGALFRAYPNDRDESVPVEPGAGQLLPDAIELDSSVGLEVLHLVVCKAPFTARDLRAAGARSLNLPPGCRAAAFELDKEGR
jgi:hypothetical protein